MSDTILIEEAGLAFLDSVMDVMADSFDPAFGEAWTAPQCAGLLPMPGVWLSLAREGDRVVGFALSRAVLREAELLLLAVARSHQRRGVGAMLLDRFTMISQRKGVEDLHLEVRDGNPALRLYEGAGFREVGRRRNYYSGNDGRLYDALTLSRSAKS
ncbi:MAG: family N-acetyltransferase [Alphaproteobacteria bacterium]|nr:family N-acetyltransferase [Alphaproteobacteria bacterium]MDB5722329.1 family N-acetyltransferase [Alphaproteobacteria bacterium]